MKNPARNLGVDLLRIISMLGVVFLHVLGHGGILAADLSPTNFSLVWFIETLTYPAVNCFVLISGYVGYKGARYFPKMKSLFSLYFTVLFYSLAFYVVMTALDYAPLGLGELAKNLLPIISKRYWFFSIYFGMFLLSPALNLLVDRSKPRPIFFFLVALLLLCGISLVRDRFSLMNGFSLIWFVLLYLVGAILKKYQISDLLSKKGWLVLVAVSFAAAWIPLVLLTFVRVPILSNYGGILINYVSPTMVLMAVGLLCLFSKLELAPRAARPISFFAVSAFSVYLIHENQYIRTHFMTRIHLIAERFSEIWLIPFVIAVAIAIFLLGILVDKIRMGLFQLLGVNKLAGWLDRRLKTPLNALYKKAERKLCLK